MYNTHTVEPQTLRIKDKIRSTKTSLSYSANTFITSEERNLSIMNRITCPKSYIIQRFHCIHVHAHVMHMLCTCTTCYNNKTATHSKVGSTGSTQPSGRGFEGGGVNWLAVLHPGTRRYPGKHVVRGSGRGRLGGGACSGITSGIYRYKLYKIIECKKI